MGDEARFDSRHRPDRVVGRGSGPVPQAGPEGPAHRLEQPGFITTATGGRFWPLDPHVREVEIRDIAASLARTARYRGHFTRHPFYSVAEHCVLLARYGEARGWRPAFVLHALLHDAAEAYLCDVPAPVKPLMPEYVAIERRVERVVWAAFGLPPALPRAVQLADWRIRSDEIAQLGRADHDGWCRDWAPLGVTLECWAPDAAAWNFMATFDRLALSCCADASASASAPARSPAQPPDRSGAEDDLSRSVSASGEADSPASRAADTGGGRARAALPAADLSGARPEGLPAAAGVVD